MYPEQANAVETEEEGDVKETLESIDNNLPSNDMGEVEMLTIFC